MVVSFSDFAYAFVTLFVIMDPFACIPSFLALTRGMNEKKKLAAARQAVTIAGVLALVVLVSGQGLLNVLGISLTSFKISGGLVLGLLGLQMVLGFSFNKNKKDEGAAIAVIIATPLLTGPGMISSIILLTPTVGVPMVFAAILASSLLAWLILSNANRIVKLMGEQNLQIASKVMGMLLIAIAVEMIKNGIIG